MTLATWSGTHTFTAPRVVDATSVDEVRQVVATEAAAGQRVRALGTRHSFNDLADSTGTLVTVTGIAPDPVLDEAACTVTVGGGIRYGDLAVWLEARGWALHNMGSLPHISVAGATATSTHGSGNTLGTLSTAVRAIEYVDAGAGLRTVRHGDADFDALVVGLGAVGISTRVTLAVEPTYRVRQDAYRDLHWQTVLDDLDSVTGGGYSVSLFTNWLGDTIGEVLVKTRVAEGDGDLPTEYFGAARREAGLMILSGDNVTVGGGLPGPWSERLPHFRLDATPSDGNEIQTEYFVDRAVGPDALRAVRALGEQIAPHLLITELRTAKADTLWLSGAYQRDFLAIHFTWKPEPDAVAALLPSIEQALAPFDARPHWGKWHRFTAERLAAVHPRIADARALFERLDPTGVFSNSYLERLGLRDTR